MDLTVEELRDDSAIAAFLEGQRLWTAYALCDLELAYRRHSRYLGALRGGQIAATALVYAAPGFHGLLPFGENDGVEAIMSTELELPAQSFLLLGEEHLQAVEHRYRVDHPWPMRRMAVRAAGFSPPATIASAARLSVDDLSAMEELYGTERNSAFYDAATLEHGVYFGVYEGRSLVAAAGTHAWSRTHRIGAVGGVFTRPDRRGRGLAQSTTGAVTQKLFELGVEDVVLNVRADNAPALHCYQRLGFTTVRSYLEGHAVDRRHESTQAQN